MLPAEEQRAQLLARRARERNERAPLERRCHRLARGRAWREGNGSEALQRRRGKGRQRRLEVTDAAPNAAQRVRTVARHLTLVVAVVRAADRRRFPHSLKPRAGRQHGCAPCDASTARRFDRRSALARAAREAAEAAHQLERVARVVRGGNNAALPRVRNRAHHAFTSHDERPRARSVEINVARMPVRISRGVNKVPQRAEQLFRRGDFGGPTEQRRERIFAPPGVVEILCGGDERVWRNAPLRFKSCRCLHRGADAIVGRAAAAATTHALRRLLLRFPARFLLCFAAPLRLARARTHPLRSASMSPLPTAHRARPNHCVGVLTLGDRPGDVKVRALHFVGARGEYDNGAPLPRRWQHQAEAALRKERARRERAQIKAPSRVRRVTSQKPHYLRGECNKVARPQHVCEARRFHGVHDLRRAVAERRAGHRRAQHAQLACTPLYRGPSQCIVATATTSRRVDPQTAVRAHAERNHRQTVEGINSAVETRVEINLRACAAIVVDVAQLSAGGKRRRGVLRQKAVLNEGANRERSPPWWAIGRRARPAAAVRRERGAQRASEVLRRRRADSQRRALQRRAHCTRGVANVHTRGEQCVPQGGERVAGQRRGEASKGCVREDGLLRRNPRAAERAALLRPPCGDTARRPEQRQLLVHDALQRILRDYIEGRLRRGDRGPAPVELYRRCRARPQPHEQLGREWSECESQKDVIPTGLRRGEVDTFTRSRVRIAMCVAARVVRSPGTERQRGGASIGSSPVKDGEPALELGRLQERARRVRLAISPERAAVGGECEARVRVHWKAAAHRERQKRENAIAERRAGNRAGTSTCRWDRRKQRRCDSTPRHALHCSFEKSKLARAWGARRRRESVWRRRSDKPDDDVGRSLGRRSHGQLVRAARC